MKKVFSIFLAMFMFSMLIVPASAAEMNAVNGVSRSVISAEIENEVAVAQEVLDKPCVMAEEDVKAFGDYVMVSRLYVADEPQTRASARSIGALSAVTWYKRGESSWTYKVQLAGWFDYDGTEAECVDHSFTAVDDTYDPVAYTRETRMLSGEVAAVNVYCEVGDENLPATLMVTCTKDGDLGYRSDNKYFS